MGFSGLRVVSCYERLTTFFVLFKLLALFVTV